ncbi:MAG TPA: hypothetical protein PLB63_02445 [Planctomycetota bacterium]|nr:hypothetical protein [Planctomycetota bacterium]
MENLQNLLKILYSDNKKLEEWLNNPQEKTKEWGFELDQTSLQTLDITLHAWYTEQQQIQAMQSIHQRSVQKLNEAVFHSKITFYSTLVIHFILLIASILLFITGIYALFGTKPHLGIIFCSISLLEIIYFLLAKPFQTLNDQINNNVQMEVALGGWYNEMTYWKVFLQNTHLEEKQAVSQCMRDSTKWAIMLIENYCSLPNRITDKEQKQEKKYFQEFLKNLQQQTSNLGQKVNHVVQQGKQKIQEKQQAKQQEQQAKQQEQQTENKDKQIEQQEQKTENKDKQTEQQEQKTENKDKQIEQQEKKTESKEQQKQTEQQYSLKKD